MCWLGEVFSSGKGRLEYAWKCRKDQAGICLESSVGFYSGCRQALGSAQEPLRLLGNLCPKVKPPQ